MRFNQLRDIQFFPNESSTGREYPAWDDMFVKLWDLEGVDQEIKSKWLETQYTQQNKFDRVLRKDDSAMTDEDKLVYEARLKKLNKLLGSDWWRITEDVDEALLARTAKGIKELPIGCL